MTTIAVIPLRGGSKSIPLKNIKDIAGKPLCRWVIEAAVGCRSIDEVWVSTESDLIAQVVRGFGYPVGVHDRPVDLAADETSTEAVMLEFLARHPCDTLVTIQATSPLLTAGDLAAGIAAFRAQDMDSLLSAARIRHFFWSDDCVPLNYDPISRPRRQDWSGTLKENGAFYVCRADRFADCKCRLFGKIGIHEMDPVAAAELDEPEDWLLVERLLRGHEAAA